MTLTNDSWTPKPGDKAFYVDDVKVTIVRESDTPGIFFVRYAEDDAFGERAEFAADRGELLPREA